MVGSINLRHKECDWLICQSHHTQMDSSGEYQWCLDLTIVNPIFAILGTSCNAHSSTLQIFCSCVLYIEFFCGDFYERERERVGNRVSNTLCNNYRIFFLSNRGALENIGIYCEQKLIICPLWKTQPKQGIFWFWVFLKNVSNLFCSQIAHLSSHDRESPLDLTVFRIQNLD